MSDTPIRAFTFPGQGAQSVGMGKDLADAFPQAKAVFDEVDQALGLKLTDIMWNGPEEDLTLTMNTQPALMAVSMAVVRVLEAEAGLDLAKHAKFVAGHSLGEYAALCAAGAFDIATAARLLRLRGEAMQRAVPVGAGAMAATLGLENDKVNDAAEQAASETGEPVGVANDNANGQVVISGSKAGVDRACEIAKELGAKRAMPLAVSAPFHCALMRPAAERLAERLAGVSIVKPEIAVINNVDVAVYDEPEKIRDALTDEERDSSLLGGVIIVEYIFDYPGLGLLTINAVLQRDFPLIQGIAIVTAAIFVIINILVDLAATTIDPRLEY